MQRGAREQIDSSIKNQKGYMRSIYETAKQNPDSPYAFEWKGKGFNQGLVELVSTENGRVIGAFAGDFKREVTVGKGGSYSVKATMNIEKTGKYSWKLDRRGRERLSQIWPWPRRMLQFALVAVVLMYLVQTVLVV